jgi:hypothetical protein
MLTYPSKVEGHLGGIVIDKAGLELLVESEK